jgi:hypothetical protein
MTSNSSNKSAPGGRAHAHRAVLAFNTDVKKQSNSGHLMNRLVPADHPRSPEDFPKRSAPVFGNGLRLTEKQERFCERIAGGGRNSEAYRGAYDTRKMKPQTVWREALRLRRNPRVAWRIEQIEEEASFARRRSTERTVCEVTDFLEEMMRAGKSDRSRLRAAYLLGASVGLFVKR